mmetsp:Transcript_8010/g.5694  ORF Transcript_8010/g.5694 Transcript_8010/m.5694 type:complete len:87 (+) Transcript_8010:101-361(+)
MGPDDEPITNKKDLVEAITQHFAKEYTCNETETIVKFLKLKKEEKNEKAYSLRNPMRPMSRALAGSVTNLASTTHSHVQSRRNIHM